jgi:subtilisin family serine protease
VLRFAQTNPLDVVKLRGLMASSRGNPALALGLIDGPVRKEHADLVAASIEDVLPASGDSFRGEPGTCAQPDASACVHGTFVAGILVARRGSPAPAVCPECQLLVRPIFGETADGRDAPAATPEELGQAIVECVDAGARVLNVSAATGEPSTRTERELEQSLDYAAGRGALLVAAAGNQGTLGSSAITRHPWVLPVVGYEGRGRPMSQSNLGSSIGRRGVGAPGEAIESLGATGAPLRLSGTSFATAFVTGAIGLLWSQFPGASASEIKAAVTRVGRRTAVAPPLLDASAAYEEMATSVREKSMVVA